MGKTPQPEKPKGTDFEFAAILAFCKLGEAVTFPEGSMQDWVDSIKTMAKDHGMPSDIFDNSIAYADTVSSVIMAWSKKDNYDQTRSYTKYSVVDSPGRWIPTPPAYTQAMEPHWNAIRNLVIDSVNQFIPHPSYKFDMTHKNSPYYYEVKLSYDIVNNSGAGVS